MINPINYHQEKQQNQTKMATQYNFQNKSIKCTSWWQMIHLSEIAHANKLRDWYLCERNFREGAVYFVVDVDGDYMSRRLPEGEEVDYHEFINQPRKENDNTQNFGIETKTKKVAGCKGCPLYTRIEQHDYQYCSYPSKEQSCQLWVDMFAKCPLKEKSLTIEIG
jgi:hypothetical protein